MRFDAYAGNIAGPSLDDVAEVFRYQIGATVSLGTPRRRYGQVLEVNVGGRTAVWVGRDHGNDLIYFEGKGETTPDVVEAVRASFPHHTCSRGDTCIDHDEEGAFECLHHIIKVGKGPRVYGGFARLSDDPTDGRTYEAGKRGGVAYCRLYEAGKVQDRLHFGRPNWCRTEFEIRPHYARDKVAAASMSPEQMLGFSAWTKNLGEVLLATNIPRFEPEERHTSFDKTRLYLARAFRRHWEQSKEDGQDWVCIGKEIEAIWAADDAVFRK